jgi:hypothetical protein
MTEQNNRRKPEDINIDDELEFCAELGQELFKQLLKKTNGDGPRVILSTAILIAALCEGREGVLETILQGVDLIEMKVEFAKEMLMAQAKHASIN